MTSTKETDSQAPSSDFTNDEPLQNEKKHVELVPKPAGIQRLRKCLYVLAGFFLYLNTSGILNTFGVYQAYYQTHTLYSSSPSAISWIGSIQVFIGMAFGLFTGPLYDRGYLRPLVITGSFLTVFGLMMTSISRSYSQLFLAQGVCIGLGMGFTYVPMLAEVSKQFATRRPVALGICSTGAVFGGTAIPIMLRQLIPKIGFGQAVRCVALVNLGCALIALAIICRRPNEAFPARRLLDPSALRERPYALFTLALFLICLPYYVPFTYIPLFAQTALHSSENLAGYLLAIANTGSLFGRVMPYMLNARFTPIRLFVFWTLASAALLFAWVGVVTIPGFIVWCVLWGFVSGALVTAPIAAISHRVLSPSPGKLGTRMGMAWFAAAAGELLGAPIAGALVDVRTFHYTLAQAIPGVIMISGAICLIWPMIAISRSDQREREKEGKSRGVCSDREGAGGSKKCSEVSSNVSDP